MILLYLIFTITFILAFFLLFPFVSTLLARLVSNRKLNPAKSETDFACIITAYKDAEITIPLVDSLLKQQYANYVIYLVADACDVSKIQFSSDKFFVLKPGTTLGSKVKSIQYAISHYVRKHTATLIFDPDNLAHPEFLQQINAYFMQGYQAVQGQRTAKNLDSVYACMDGMGEMYYNCVGRNTPFLLGSSATIAGSGMAIDTDLYMAYLRHDDIAGNINKVIVAEDKILQTQLVEKGIRIAYAKDAIVYDEKVVTGTQVERQRTRWLNSYFKHLPEGLHLLLSGITQLNWNKIYFGYLLIYPPMFLLMVISVIVAAFSLLVYWQVTVFLMGCMALFSLNFLLVLKLNRAPRQMWASLWAIPLFMRNQFFALLKIQRSNKDFMSTVHTRHLTIEEVMQSRG